VLLVATLSVAWYGVMLTVPHDHVDSSVPREELSCSASHPTSETQHLHRAGRVLSPHPCLACLAGTAIPEVLKTAVVDGFAVHQRIDAAAATDLRSRLHSRLPFLRGPPLTS
jgi:hypothetical protein